MPQEKSFTLLLYNIIIIITIIIITTTTTTVTAIAVVIVVTLENKTMSIKCCVLPLPTSGSYSNS